MLRALAIGFVLASSAGNVCAAELLRAPNYDWSGPYIGAHVGKAWGETGNSWRNTVITDWQPDGDISYEGTASGLHLGYLWQRGSLVYGIEGDITWSSLNGDDSQFAGLVNALEMGYVGTFRARLGFSHSNALIYATGGVALGEIEKKDLTLGSSNSNDAVGWAMGGGLEYALWDRLRVRVEYQYVDFGSVVSSLGYDHRADDINIQSVRGGISYGF